MITASEAFKMTKEKQISFGNHDTYSILHKIEEMIDDAIQHKFYSISLHKDEIPNVDAILAFFANLGYGIAVNPNEDDIVHIVWLEESHQLEEKI